MKSNKISTAQLARMCNVSQGTVDRALHNRPGVSEKTKEHILSVAKEYGYRPNKCDANKLVGIIVFDLYNSYFAELIVELETEFRKYGYYSLVMFSNKDKKTERECIETVYNAGVEAIIICPVNGGSEFAKYLHSWKIPVVTLGNRVEGVKYIGVNDFSAMHDLTEKIIAGKKNKLIYFSPSLQYTDCNNYSQKQRYLGFESAVQKHSNVSYTVVKDEDILRKTVKKHDMIIASTDYYALKVLFSGIADKGNVAGFDCIPDTEKFGIPLLTVAFDRMRIAKYVADYVINQGNDEDVIVEHRIIGELVE